MPTNQFSPPAADELEISLFGPGYGEAIVVHLGDQNWLTVDSCLEPTTGVPAALHYLRALHVDVASQIKLVVATHWHDDHIRGISHLVRESASAKVVVSAALSQDKFLQLFALYRGMKAMRSSGLDEFVELYNILQDRKSKETKVAPPVLAMVDRLLFEIPVGIGAHQVTTRIYALSPSDTDLYLSSLSFGNLLVNEADERKRLPSVSPNHTSAVLWCEVGPHTILLGADLEHVNDPSRGWTAILDKSIVVSGKRATAFKVAHHGAKSGHNPRVWSELLVSEPHAVLTPYTRGAKPLPTPDDTARLTELTSHGYITASPVQRRHRWANKVVREMVEQATRRIYDVHGSWGHLRLRCSLTSYPSTWNVELFGAAVSLNDLLTNPSY